MVLGVWYGSG